MRIQIFKKSALLAGFLIAIAITVVLVLTGQQAQVTHAVQAPVFTYEIDGMIFESTDSKEDAWQQTMTYQYEQGLITEDEIQLAYDDFTREHYAGEITTSNNGFDLIMVEGTGVLTGKL